ncbi:MAG: hypothetical protein AAB897_03635 [Patescibacteria group bacterium]
MPKDLGNTQDLVAIEEIKEDTVVLKGGALRQIIMVSGVNFALKSEVEQNVITQSYQNFLNGLDFNIQIVIHSRKVNVEKYLGIITRFEEMATVPLIKNQASEYKEFIRSFVSKNAIMEKTFLVLVPFASVALPSAESVTSGISLPFFKKKDAKETEAKAKEASEERFKEDLAQLRQRTTQVVDGLYSVGLESVVLNTEQLIQLFYNFYNPETIERENMEIPNQ